MKDAFRECCRILVAMVAAERRGDSSDAARLAIRRHYDKMTKRDKGLLKKLAMLHFSHKE